MPVNICGLKVCNIIAALIFALVFWTAIIVPNFELILSYTKTASPGLRWLISTQVGIDFGRLTTLSEMDELLRLSAPDAPKYDDEVLLSCSCSVVEIQTSRITNRWYRFWCRVGIFVMQCAGTMMAQHLITIKKVAGPRPGAVRIVTPSGSRDANEREYDARQVN